MPFDFPASPVTGQKYVAYGAIYEWDGEKWVGGIPAGTSSLIVSDTAPTNPVTNAAWFQSNTGILWLWYQDPTGPAQWLQVNASQAVPDAPSDGGRYYRQNGVWVKDTSLRVLKKETQATSTAWSRTGISEVQMSDPHSYFPVSRTSTIFMTCYTYLRLSGVANSVDDQAGTIAVRFYNGSAYAGGYTQFMGDYNRVTVAANVGIYANMNWPTVNVSGYRVVGGIYDGLVLARLNGNANYATNMLESFSFYTHWEEVEA